MTSSHEDDDDTVTSVFNLFNPRTESICPFADITLVVDDGLHQQLKIRVSSCILTMASPVFRALFSPKYAEGQIQESNDTNDSGGKGTRHIPVEDNPDAMSLLCRLLHHQVQAARIEKLSDGDVLELALVSDKYDVTEAIRLQAKAMSFDFVDKDSWPMDFEVVAAAAYLFQDRDFFRRFSMEMVMRFHLSSSKNLHERSLDLLPPAFYSTLKGQNSDAQHEFASQLTDLVDDFTRAADFSGKQHQIYGFLNLLRNAGVWPLDFKRETLANMLSSLERVDIPSVTADSDIHKDDFGLNQLAYRHDSFGGWGAPSPPLRAPATPEVSIGRRRASSPVHQAVNAPTQRRIDTIVSAVKQICVGACIDCIKGDGECLCVPQSTDPAVNIRNSW